MDDVIAFFPLVLWRSDMARALVNDERWEIVRPLLPPLPPHTTPAGRKRIDQRRVVTGIVFILQSGIAWEMLPGEMGCACGISDWLGCIRGFSGLAAPSSVGERSVRHYAIHSHFVNRFY
jgi:hypothetical protein